MSLHLSAALMVCCLTTATFAQEQSGKAGSSKPDYSQEAFVIEQSAARVKFENDGTSTRDDTARIRVQSDAGIQRYGLLTFSYGGAMESLEIDYVRVRKPDGTIVITPPDSIQDMAAQITREAPFYSDLREKQVAVKGLGIGDTLEFETHKRVTAPLAPGQFWLEYSFFRDSILLQEQLEVSVPRERSIKIKSPDAKPTVSDAGAYRIYTWTSSNLQHKSDEKEKQEQVKAAWQQVRGRYPQPDVLLTSFQSWEEIGRWYGGLQQERVKPTAEIRAKAAELTKGATDDEAKLRAIYHYVGTQFRYIGVAFGIGRYQPHSASDVLENRYGDCKDKHTLLASLLNAAGIKAYPALISTVRDIDPEVPSPLEFNHVITVVPRGNGLIWLDTTTEVGAFQYLLAPLRDKRALVVWDDRPATLVNTPADLPFGSTQTFHMEGKLNDAGTLEGKAYFETRGELEFVLRAAFRSVALPQWKDLAQRISYGFGFGGDVSEVTASSPEKTDEPFHFAYKYTRKEYGDWENRRILAPAPAIGLPPSDDQAAPPVPLWLGSPGEVTFHTELELPAGYTPEIPAAIHLKEDFAEYDATYAFKDGKLISDRKMRVKTREVPAAEYEEYKKFHKKVQDDYLAFIPLNSGRASASKESPMAAAVSSLQDSFRELPDSADPDALRLEGEARDAISRKDTPGAISSLYRAVAADPKFTRAWIMLGSLLFSTKQTDAGLDAFHKAIAADPKRPFAYKALGYTLMGSAKFEEAIPIWQDYSRLAPDDVDGPGNLGSAFFSLKRYAQAAAALEEAVKLKPELADLQWQLASAYLRAGADDKAAAGFRKAVEMNPSADVLNNSAYELAEADKQLPLALEFAEKAVQKEEEASIKTDLSKLQVEDLAHTDALAAYWDTIGWVQSRQSKLDQAEQYLNAAWRLSQDGVAASHLCQVYERQHKTQAAVRMCQLAIHRLQSEGGVSFHRAADELEATRKRLAHLNPGSGKSSENMNATIDEVIRMRTFKLNRLVPGTATAEFFVLLTPDPKTAGFKVHDVKFIKGSDKLKASGKVLNSLNLNMPVPDRVPSRVVRRGVLGCYQYGGCEFVLLDPTIVHSLD